MPIKRRLSQVGDSVKEIIKRGHLLKTVDSKSCRSDHELAFVWKVPHVVKKQHRKLSKVKVMNGRQWKRIERMVPASKPRFHKFILFHFLFRLCSPSFLIGMQ
jgi:hypothetical protein